MVMEEWNETTQPYPVAVTAPALFEAQASRTPDGVALVFEGVEVRYSELLTMTSRLALRLVEGWDVGADSVVGLCVEKSVEEVCGMVGIMRGGGAYVPLDPKLPVDRLCYLVDQCGCGVVVSQGKHVGVSWALGVDACVAEDALWDEAVGQPNGHGMPCCDPQSLAYVLFTSGTTGKPKGVMVEHSALVTFLLHASGPYLSLIHISEPTRPY